MKMILLPSLLFAPAIIFISLTWKNVYAFTLIEPLISPEIFALNLTSQENQEIGIGDIKINYCYKPQFCQVVKMFSWIESTTITCDDVKDHINVALNKWQILVRGLKFHLERECDYYTHINFTYAVTEPDNHNLLGLTSGRIEYMFFKDLSFVNQTFANTYLNDESNIYIANLIVAMKYSEVTLLDNPDQTRCLYWNNSFYRWVASFPEATLIVLGILFPLLIAIVDMITYREIVVKKSCTWRKHHKIIFYFLITLPQIFVCYFYLFSAILVGCEPSTTVILHEIGHVMGLGHDQNKYGLMYPITYPQTFPCIGQDERAGIHAIFSYAYTYQNDDNVGDQCIYETQIFSYSVLWLSFFSIISGIIMTLILIVIVRQVVIKRLRETIIFIVTVPVSDPVSVVSFDEINTKKQKKMNTDK